MKKRNKDLDYDEEAIKLFESLGLNEKGGKDVKEKVNIYFANPNDFN